MELGGYSSEGGLSLLLKYLLRPVALAAAFRRVRGTPAATARVQKWCTPVALAAACRASWLARLSIMTAKQGSSLGKALATWQ